MQLRQIFSLFCFNSESSNDVTEYSQRLKSEHLRIADDRLLAKFQTVLFSAFVWNLSEKVPFLDTF